MCKSLEAFPRPGGERQLDQVPEEEVAWILGRHCQRDVAAWTFRTGLDSVAPRCSPPPRALSPPRRSRSGVRYLRAQRYTVFTLEES